MPNLYLEASFILYNLSYAFKLKYIYSLLFSFVLSYCVCGLYAACCTNLWIWVMIAKTTFTKCEAFLGQ
jgi:hypothetical protein